MEEYSKTYQNPLGARYATARMLYIFSPYHKFQIWRELWIALAKTQRALGLDVVTDEMIEELERFRNTFEPSVALAFEKRLKHDVMAQIEAYGKLVPKARKILHLGATSAFVTDNGDLICMREGLWELQGSLREVVGLLRDFALQYKDLPTLGYTHFQAAQLTTVGKRAALWMQSFVKDLELLTQHAQNLTFLGVKGTTGTQASFKDLFEGDFSKVRELDQQVAEAMGFSKVVALSGQTYDRKEDHTILALLSGIAQSAHKLTNDLRLLQHLKELEEPFGEEQVGSSAMAYKRNPIYSERVASLSKYLLSLSLNPPLVASTQWFERTLDDSANRRLCLPEAFLSADAILRLLKTLLRGLKVYPTLIDRHVRAELPFMATETLLMEAVKRGMDRQESHKILRDLSMESVREMKERGGENDLLVRIAKDGRLGFSEKDLQKILDPENFVGFAPQQVQSYIKEVVDPLLTQLAQLEHKAVWPEELEDSPPCV